MQKKTDDLGRLCLTPDPRHLAPESSRRQESKRQGSGIRDQGSEGQRQETGEGSQKRKTRSQKTEVRSQKTGVGDQGSGVSKITKDS
jgi:hypothetical protein